MLKFRMKLSLVVAQRPMYKPGGTRGEAWGAQTTLLPICSFLCYICVHLLNTYGNISQNNTIGYSNSELLSWHSPSMTSKQFWSGVGAVASNLWPLLQILLTVSAAAAQGPLLTLHVLQFYDFHLGAPPSAVDARGHMWVLKGPTTSAADLGAGHPLGAPAVCGWGAHSHRHRCRGCHCGNWLAVARGGECWVLGVVGTGAPGARTVPAARGGPFSRNLKGVSAWPIGRWP